MFMDMDLFVSNLYQPCHDLLLGGGGYSDIFNIRRLGSIFGVKNFEFQYFVGFSEKMNIFFAGYFLGSSQNWTIFRGYFYTF